MTAHVVMTERIIDGRHKPAQKRLEADCVCGRFAIVTIGWDESARNSIQTAITKHLNDNQVNA